MCKGTEIAVLTRGLVGITSAELSLILIRVVKYLHLVVRKGARFLLWARFLSPNIVTYCALISA